MGSLGEALVPPWAVPDIEKNCPDSNGDHQVTAAASEEKTLPGFFDGTATLTTGDDVVHIPTPSADPRGTCE